jgi:hypothetical protein
MRCKHCGDVIDYSKFCIVCSPDSYYRKKECFECHSEIHHNIIIPLNNLPVCGNLTPYTYEDMQYFPVTCCDKLHYRR